MVAGYRAVSPGIVRLTGLIQLFGEAIEADLLFRGIDLGGLWRGDLTYRRLAVLISALPAESATKTAIRDSLTPEQLAARPRRSGHGPWSNTELLLAAIADRIALLMWQNGGGKAASKPDPIPRPGITAPGYRVTPEGITWLAEFRERRNRELGR